MAANRQLRPRWYTSHTVSCECLSFSEGGRGAKDAWRWYKICLYEVLRNLLDSWMCSINFFVFCNGIIDSTLNTLNHDFCMWSAGGFPWDSRAMRPAHGRSIDPHGLPVGWLPLLRFRLHNMLVLSLVWKGRSFKSKHILQKKRP